MNTNDKTPVKKAPVASYDIARSDETLHLATDLANFIKANKLTTQVQGKDYVNVEGWQYAGSRLGIVPIVEHVVNRSNEQELKYQAKVTLFDLRSQQTVGAGFAVCSNKESGKKFYQEFAIMSMAQTRAIGKAYRNCLAWIIRAAGYEPTPAEEMECSVAEPVKAPAALPVAAPPPTMQAVPAEAAAYASTAQKEAIIRLLNHPEISRREKTKMLLNIHRITAADAPGRIANLQKAIAEREAAPARTKDEAQLAEQERERREAAQELYDFLEANEHALGRAEYSRLMEGCLDTGWDAARILREKEMAVEQIAAAA